MGPARSIDNVLTGRVIVAVCEVWGITRAELMGKRRTRPLPWARAMLCEYLRIYAGHDSVSCGAMLKMSPEGVLNYNYRYSVNRRVYAQFKERDEELRQKIRDIKKQL